MFCLLGTLLSQSCTDLAASCHSHLSWNAISHWLSQGMHLPWLLVFYFLQSLSLPFVFIYYFLLYLFVYFLYSTTNMWASWEHTFSSCLLLGIVSSTLVETVDSGTRFTRFGSCCHHPQLCEFTPVVSFCVSWFSHVKMEAVLVSARILSLWGIKDTCMWNIYDRSGTQ